MQLEAPIAALMQEALLDGPKCCPYKVRLPPPLAEQETVVFPVSTQPDIRMILGANKN